MADRPLRQPRVTIDEIIARRAPERQAKEKARAQHKSEVEEDSDEADELENEMLADLEDEFGGGSEDDEELDGLGDDDDDDDDDEGVDEEDQSDAEETASNDDAASAIFGDEAEDGEDWLGLADEEDAEGAEASEVAYNAPDDQPGTCWLTKCFRNAVLT